MPKGQTGRLGKIEKKEIGPTPNSYETIKAFKYANDPVKASKFSPSKKKISFAEEISMRKAMVPSAHHYETNKIEKGYKALYNPSPRRRM